MEDKIKEYKKQWALKNKEKIQKKSKEHYEKNKAKKIEYQRQWREENREKHRAYSRQWQQENKEKAKERLIQWYKDHPGMRAFYSSTRKKHIYQATPSWLTEFDYTQIKCIYQVCSLRNNESDDSWHVDHVVPIRGKTVCGLHVPWNLRVITAKENMTKSNKHYD
jgi:hypothetical protein